MQRFKKYSELISCLLVAEKNNELLMKNHQSHPIGSVAFSEANATNYSRYKNYNSHGCGKSRGRGRGRGQFFGRGRGNKYNNTPQQIQTQPQKKLNSVISDIQERPQHKSKTVYFRCGSKGHWVEFIVHQHIFANFIRHH